MPQMFQYEVWPSPAPVTLYTVDDFTDGDVIFTLKREELYAFLLAVGCVSGVQCICSRMVAILRTDTFVICLISRLIWTESNEFTDIIWWITALQIYKYIDEKAKMFNLTHKKRRKNLLLAFLCFVRSIISICTNLYFPRLYLGTIMKDNRIIHTPPTPIYRKEIYKSYTICA